MGFFTSALPKEKAELCVVSAIKTGRVCSFIKDEISYVTIDTELFENKQKTWTHKIKGIALITKHTQEDTTIELDWKPRIKNDMLICLNANEKRLSTYR